ncbi:hypothetical protein B5F13_14390 [Drancourtella sp. An177]|nr:hypothetical protein B5F13_14390 [Drancourtella sp. An177]
MFKRHQETFSVTFLQSSDITTNLPMGRWDELFTGKLAATAILDRLVHHCHILSITGDSYRVKGSKQSVK